MSQPTGSPANGANRVQLAGDLRCGSIPSGVATSHAFHEVELVAPTGHHEAPRSRERQRFLKLGGTGS